MWLGSLESAMGMASSSKDALNTQYLASICVLFGMVIPSQKLTASLALKIGALKPKRFKKDGIPTIHVQVL